MKKKALWKDFYIEIKKTIGRFLSLFLITVLGVAFFSGIRASEPDMRLFADHFYDESNLMDIRVLGTMGLSSKDAEEIYKIEGIKEIMTAYSVDVLCSMETSQVAVKVMSAPNSINKLQISEGRLPEKSGECFVDNRFLDVTNYKIGDTISFLSGTKESISKTLKTTSFTIVGAGSTSYYLSLERGTTSIGNGSLSSFIVIPEEDFNMEVYTEIYITVDGAKDFICYTEPYDKKVEKVKERIEDISEKRSNIRYQDITKEADKELNLAKEKLEDGEKELKDAKLEIENGKKELKKGKKTIAKEEKQFKKADKTLLKEEKTLEKGIKEWQNGWDELQQKKEEWQLASKKLEDANREIQTGKEELFKKEDELREGKKALEEGKKQISENEKILETNKLEWEQKNKQFQTAKKQAEKEITLQEQKLKDGKEQLENAKKYLAALQKQFENGDITTKVLIETVTKQIEEQEQEIIKGEQAIKAAAGQLEENQTLLSLGQKQIEEGEKELQAAKQEIIEKEGQLREGEEKIVTAKEELFSNEQLIKENETTLLEGKEQIVQAEQLLKEKQKEIENGKTELKKAKKKLKKGKQKIKEAKEQIKAEEKKLKKGEKKYQKAKEKNQPKIEKAKKRIKKAEKELADLEKPKWYVLDRNSIQTYVEYSQDADRIGAIGKVFPAIFFLVAALISLTTMTRMVEEQRIQIGTLKALGYNKASIAVKYMNYAFLASILGSILGLYLGQKLLPVVIIKAYKILYNNLPIIEAPLHFGYSVSSCVIAVACTTLAALFACYKELAQVPAQLMRPAVPKSGKRVFLERVSFIWKRLNFSNKSTIRNLIRYKKRFYMTVFGIGGCMALLLVGFGLKDSILSIGVIQFGKVRIYDSIILLESKANKKQKEQLIETVSKDETITNFILAKETSIDIGYKEIEKSCYLMVPKEPERLSDFIVLKNRITGEKYQLNDNGIILTEKLASLLKVKKGDTVYLKQDNLRQVEVKIENIAENYFYHYIYMSPKLYKTLYKEEPKYEEIFTKNIENNKAFEENFRSIYIKKKAVANVDFISGVEKRVSDMLKSMDTIIYVLVISAGLLAFIVLYNLNNINISERIRELATLKVLGFYDKEVSDYVVRENICLTIIGCLVGIVLGLILHRYVIITAEINFIMFGRKVRAKSYIYSIILTFIFSMLVNIAMYFKLKKIDMVESMKSVE